MNRLFTTSRTMARSSRESIIRGLPERTVGVLAGTLVSGGDALNRGHGNGQVTADGRKSHALLALLHTVLTNTACGASLFFVK